MEYIIISNSESYYIEITNQVIEKIRNVFRGYIGKNILNYKPSLKAAFIESLQNEIQKILNEYVDSQIDFNFIIEKNCLLLNILSKFSIDENRNTSLTSVRYSYNTLIPMVKLKGKCLTEVLYYKTF